MIFRLFAGLSVLLFVLQNQTTFSFASDETPSECQITLYWGHGSDVVVKIKDVLTSNENMCVSGQGCFLNNAGNLPGRIIQQGYNGHHYGFSRSNNGGMNPILSKVNEKFSEYNWLNDNQDLDFTSVEEEHLKKSGGRFVTKKRELSSVGFMRMTQHHWLTSLIEAEKRLTSLGKLSLEKSAEKNCVECAKPKNVGVEQPAWIDSISKHDHKTQDGKSASKCEKVKLTFTCASPGMGNDEYGKRLKFAKDSQIFSEVEKSKITFRSFSCGKDSVGNLIFNTPLKCDDTFVFNQSKMRDIKTGSCSKEWKNALNFKPLIQGVK